MKVQALLSALVLAACSSGGGGGEAGTSGAGESCVATPDCMWGLDCVESVCIDPNAPDIPEDIAPDVTEDTKLAAKDSQYTLTITMFDGTVYELDRDLEGKEDVYSFGSAHIGTAVAFSMEDHITFPATMVNTIDFGKVIGSSTFPVQCPGAGAYPFTGYAPQVKVFVEGIQYVSTGPESEGSLIVEEYGNVTGQIMSGTIAGRIWHDKEAPSLYIDIEATFHFTLPVKGDGQPGG